MASRKTALVPGSFLKEQLMCLSRNHPFLSKAMLRVKVERLWESLPENKRAKYVDPEKKCIRKSSLCFSFDVECEEISQKKEPTHGRRHYGKRTRTMSQFDDTEWKEASWTDLAQPSNEALVRDSGAQPSSSSHPVLNMADMDVSKDLVQDTASAGQKQRTLVPVPSGTCNSSTSSERSCAFDAKRNSGMSTGCSKTKSTSSRARKKPALTSSTPTRRKTRRKCENTLPGRFKRKSSHLPNILDEQEILGFDLFQSYLPVGDGYQSSSFVLAGCLNEMAQLPAPSLLYDGGHVNDSSIGADSSLMSCSLLSLSDEDQDMENKSGVAVNELSDAHSSTGLSACGASEAQAVPAIETVHAGQQNHVASVSPTELSTRSSGEISVSPSIAPDAAHTKRIASGVDALECCDQLPVPPSPTPLSCSYKNESSPTAGHCTTPRHDDVRAVQPEVSRHSNAAHVSDSLDRLSAQPDLMSLFDSPPATPNQLSRRSLSSVGQAIAMSAGSGEPGQEPAGTVVASSVFM